MARAGWEALASQLRGALARRALRRVALAQPGVTAVEVAQDDEAAMLRLAVHLHMAVGCDAAAVTARAREAIRRRLPFGEIAVRIVGVAR